MKSELRSHPPFMAADSLYIKNVTAPHLQYRVLMSYNKSADIPRLER